VHRNDFEHIAPMMPLALFNGLIYPWTTIACLTGYFVGRKAYTAGYQEKEGAFNQYRIFGSVVCNVTHIGTILMTLFIGFRMARGNLCLQKALQIGAK